MKKTLIALMVIAVPVMAQRLDLVSYSVTGNGAQSQSVRGWVEAVSMTVPGLTTATVSFASADGVVWASTAYANETTNAVTVVARPRLETVDAANEAISTNARAAVVGNLTLTVSDSAPTNRVLTATATIENAR
jgi:hypothetical protein